MLCKAASAAILAPVTRIAACQHRYCLPCTIRLSNTRLAECICNTAYYAATPRHGGDLFGWECFPCTLIEPAVATELSPLCLRAQRRIESTKKGRNVFFKAVSSAKSKRLGALSGDEDTVLQAITAAGNMGVWTKTLKTQTKLQVTALNKALKRLEGKKLIKSVKSVTYKNRKIYMLYDLVPSPQVTGGAWYSDGHLDRQFIQAMRRTVLQVLTKHPSSLLADIVVKTREAGTSKIPLGAVEVQQLLDSLVYDGYAVVLPGCAKAGSSELVEGVAGSEQVKAYAGSGGEVDTGDPKASEVRYNPVRSKVPPISPLTDLPCGSCPVFEKCSPGGLISPERCVYFDSWLDEF